MSQHLERALLCVLSCVVYNTAFDRHRAKHAAFDWQLLNEEERALVRHLAALLLRLGAAALQKWRRRHRYPRGLLTALRTVATDKWASLIK